MSSQRPFVLNRRRGLLLISGLLSLPWSLRVLLAGRADANPPVARLAAALGPRGSVEAIGRAYLEEAGGAFDADTTKASLARRLDAQGIDWHAASVRRLARGLGAIVEADLRESRVVTVDGWVMARTEVEVCALYAACA